MTGDKSIQDIAYFCLFLVITSFFYRFMLYGFGNKNLLLMRTTTIVVYFIIAIILFASIGVYIPYILEIITGKQHNNQDLNQNLVTYFIAIFASACLDLLLNLIDKDTRTKKLQILILILISIVVFAATATLLYYNLTGHKDKILGWLILGTLLSWLMWWIAHFKDEAFNPPTSTLGGNPNRTLNNG
jgi:hypothetical protein